MRVFYFVIEVYLLFHPVIYISGAPESHVASGFHAGRRRSRPRKVLGQALNTDTSIYESKDPSTGSSLL